MLDDLNVELIALADGYRSLRDPELIFLVYAERAQAGRQEIAKNVRAGIVEAARRGIWPAGALPFGYRKTGRFTIVEHPEAAALVRTIFAGRLRGWPIRRICQHLNDDVRARGPGWWRLTERIERLTAEADPDCDDRARRRLLRLQEKLLVGRFRWQQRTVRLILANTAYKGLLQYNRTTTIRRMHGRLVREGRPPSDWVTLPCPPLVKAEEWAMAQGSGALARLPRRGRSSVWLLSGLLICAVCGHTMRGHAASAAGADGTRRRKGYYVCSGAQEYRLHPAGYIPADALEEAVVRGVVGQLVQVPVERLGGARIALESAGPCDAGMLDGALADLAEARFYRREALRKGLIAEAVFTAELAILEREERRLIAVRTRESAVSVHSASSKPSAADLFARLARSAQMARPGQGDEGPNQKAAALVKRLLALLVRQAVVTVTQEVTVHLIAPPHPWRIGGASAGLLRS